MVLSDIEYISMCDFDREFEHQNSAYKGMLSFRTPNQRWTYMNNNPGNKGCENINPVSFCVIQGNRVKVYNTNRKPLQLNVDTMVYLEKGYVRIKNRKWNLPQEEARKRFPIADESEFRDEDGFESI